MEQKHLDAFYEFKGWNNEGIPTKETLDKLGLDYVSEDFLQRGILADNEGTPSKETSAEKDKTIPTLLRGKYGEPRGGQ